MENEFKFESEKEFRARFANGSKWEIIECDDDVEYSLLCMDRDCWYRVHREYPMVIRKLSGIEDLVLCDKCWSKEEHADEYIEEYINKKM
jgi:hypothetical protein